MICNLGKLENFNRSISKNYLTINRQKYGIPFDYLSYNYKTKVMLTSIEIAKILIRQKQKAKKLKGGFDAGLLGLGGTISTSKGKK